MRYGIFSDIHSNFEALQAVLWALNKENIDKFVCLGDIIGYGPDPNLCIRKIRDLDCNIVAGNHDWGVAQKIDLKYFNFYAAESLLWTRQLIDDNDLSYLGSLNIKYENSDLCAAHACYDNPKSFKYLYQMHDAIATFNLMPVNVCFVGHTHIPVIFKSNLKVVNTFKKTNFAIEPGLKYIFNVGSVGQPRDGINTASFCVFDTKKKLVEFKRISYNLNIVINKIRKRGLAEFLAQRLGQGR